MGLINGTTITSLDDNAYFFLLGLLGAFYNYPPSHVFVTSLSSRFVIEASLMRLINGANESKLH